jgi:hypothetical protein
LDDGTHGGCQRRDGLRRDVREWGFAVAPEPFHRMECGARGRQPSGHDVRRPAHGCGCVPGAVIEHSDSAGLWPGHGAPVPPEWQRPPGAGGQCEQAAHPGSRFDRARHRAIVTLVGHGGDRLDAPGGHATPHHGQEAQAGVVWGKALEWANGRAGFELLGEEGGPGRLQRWHCGGGFGRARRGRLGWACR